MTVQDGQRKGGNAGGKPRPTRPSAPAPDKPIPAWVKLPTLWVVVPLALLAGIYIFTTSAVPAMEARLGGGTRGQFTAHSCRQKPKGGCDWVGDFIGTQGTDKRYGVAIESQADITQVGQKVAAIDTGGDEVYLAEYSTAWFGDTAGDMICLGMLLAWALFLPVRTLRKRTRRRTTTATPTSA